LHKHQQQQQQQQCNNPQSELHAPSFKRVCQCARASVLWL
jgi:hypothetical protein